MGAVFARIMSSPIVLFFALGAVLFALENRFGGGPAPSPQIIRLTSADQALLASVFEERWRRPPTETELDALIAARIDEELMLREALALGLDTDDAVIRQRLTQKITLLIDDLATGQDPDEAALAAFLEAHAEMYRIPQLLDFQQVYLSREKRGDSIEADAARLLADLRGGADPETVGDAIGLPASMKAAAPVAIARMFGNDFAASLSEAAESRWFGPVASSHGLHLVTITQKVPSRPATLDQVRPALLRDWRTLQRQEARKAYLARLREKYTVEIEEPAAQ